MEKPSVAALLGRRRRNTAQLMTRDGVGPTAGGAAADPDE